MTAIYSLLEQPIIKQPIHKRWIIAFITIGALTIMCYLIYFTRLNYIEKQQETAHSSEGETSKDTTKEVYIPARSINLTVPTQEDPYFIDLDKYPIEDNMMTLFAGTDNVIKTVTINKLLNKDIPWTDHLDQTVNPTTDTFSCPVQSIPYPILRHIVNQYIPLNDTDSFFEDTSISLNEPFVLLPFVNQPTFHEGDKLCVRVIVPYRPMNTSDPHYYMYRPYPKNNRDITYPWWDTTMNWLQDLDTNSTIPFLTQPWSGHRQLRMAARRLNKVSSNLPEWARLREDELYERVRMHIYEAQIILPRAGKYKLSSLLEFTEGRYNFEYGPVTPYEPTILPVLPPGSDVILVDNKEAEQDSEKLAEALLNEHMKLPLCKGSDHPGRWLPWPKTNRKQNQVLGLVYHDKFWAPYDCRYRPISYEQFNRCVSHKYGRGMDMYGDSNLRRSLKKFISHGQWCKNWQKNLTEPMVPDSILPKVNKTLVTAFNKRQVTIPIPATNNPNNDQSNIGYRSPREYKYLVPEQTRSCYCEDYTEPYWRPEWFDAGGRRVNVDMNNTLQESRRLGDTEWDDPEIRTRNPLDAFKISSYKWDGLTYLNNPPWETAVIGNTVSTDVAIFSLGNWDAAFLELDPYLRDVDRLIGQIKSHYDLNKTRIIYRTPQYYCCRVDQSSRDRQLSGPRLDLFDIEVKTKFIRELNATVWDTKILGEAKTWEEKLESINCPSNHVPADTVDIENQIFMNGLCNN